MFKKFFTHPAVILWSVIFLLIGSVYLLVPCVKVKDLSSTDLGNVKNYKQIENTHNYLIETDSGNVVRMDIYGFSNKVLKVGSPIYERETLFTGVIPIFYYKGTFITQKQASLQKS